MQGHGGAQWGILQEGYRGRHRLAPSGPLCAATAHDLEWAVALLCIDGASAIELDLQCVDVLDERGAQAIDAAGQTCAEHGFGLVLTPARRSDTVDAGQRRARSDKPRWGTEHHEPYPVFI